MALTFQDVTVDFGSGLEQKTDDKRIPIGSLVSASNVLFTKDKQLRRRYGNDTFQTYDYSSNALPLGVWLLPGYNYPAIVGSSGVYVAPEGGSYVGPGVENTAVRKKLDVSYGPTYIVDGTALGPCAATGSSTATVYVWAPTTATDRFLYEVRDSDNQLWASGSVSISSTTVRSLRALYYSGTAYFFYTGSSNIKMFAISITLGTVTTADTTVVSNANSSYWTPECEFDVLQKPSAASFYLVYKQTLSTNAHVSERTYASPGSTTWTKSVALPADASTAFAFARPTLTNDNSGTLYAYAVQCNQTTVRYLTVASDGSGSLTTGSYGSHGYTDASAGSYRTPSCITAMYYTLTGSTTSYVLISGRYANPVGTALAYRPDTRITYFSGTATAASTTTLMPLGHSLASGIFEDPDNTAEEPILMALTRGDYAVYVTRFTSTDADPVSMVFQEDSLFSAGYNGAVSPGGAQIPWTVNSKVYIPCRRNVAAITDVALQGRRQLAVVGIDNTRSRSVVTSPNGTSYACTPYPAAEGRYDGFADAPVIATNNSTASSLSGSRSIVCVATKSINGITYRSPLSNIYTGSVVTLITVVPPLRSAEFQSCTLEVYMTASGGTTYYHWQSYPINRGDQTIALSFGSADVSTANGILYTAGGVYESLMPPAGDWVSYALNRLWMPAIDNDTDIFFSTASLPGEAYRWNPAMVLSVPSLGGPIQAVVEFGGRALLFKKHAIYLITGDGPDATGSSGAFQAQLLTSTAGLEAPNAYAVTPDGVLAKTRDNGFWLFGGDTVGEYVGRGVDNYKSSSDYECFASLYDPIRKQARFLVGAEPSSIELVYDTYYKQWTVNSLSAAARSLTQTGVLGEVYYHVDASTANTARLIVEDAALSNDADSSGANVEFAINVTTGWLNFAEIDGFQRVKYVDFQGAFAGTAPFKIKVEAFYDYDDSTVGETHTFVVDSTNATKALLGRVYFTRQKTRAVKLKITNDSTYADESVWGASSLTSMTFRIGLKNQTAPAPAGSRST